MLYLIYSGLLSSVVVFNKKIVIMTFKCFRFYYPINTNVGTSKYQSNRNIYDNVYFNWQNVILTHHANVHGGSSDLLAKLLD